MDTPKQPQTHSLLVLSSPIRGAAGTEPAPLDPELVERIKRLKEWLANKETA